MVYSPQNTVSPRSLSMLVGEFLIEDRWGKTLEQNASQLLHRWQYVAPNLPNDVYSLVAIWNVVFQGGANELIPLMQERFPELGLIKEDFIEMTWIESVLFMNGLSNETSEEALLDRNRSLLPPSFKSKSDFVNEPVPEIAFQGLWPQLLEVNEASTAVQTFIAYGGMMDEISETETPFPHRKGMLYKIHYNIGWQEEENIRSQSFFLHIVPPTVECLHGHTPSTPPSAYPKLVWESHRSELLLSFLQASLKDDRL
ncbi:berberine bridge enzyme-like 13 [Gossypium hirsutum]|uniref:Berberine bridge enzyme-like 13 n=1 Tax=Gossypium hirsutum TaxID=3635 RepID=A0ABM2ZRQ2_GOSHI|nr:berberine bridge enzyme-like 13 [Gossypium hirsutum]